MKTSLANRLGGGRTALATLLLSGLVSLTGTPPLAAQLNERPDDPTGLSIREPRVRLPHSDHPAPAGSSMYLQQTRPWLAYQRGRSYFHREWQERAGAFRHLPARAIAASTNSCGMCHNRPFPSAGAGGNAAEPAGVGRNAPHLFGVGLMEMLGLQIRQLVLLAHDANGNGYLDVPEETRGRRVTVEAVPGVAVDFGALDDLDGDGFPDLNEVLTVTLVGEDGTALPFRTTLEDPRVAGFDLAVGVFSASISDHQAVTLRQFAIGVHRSVFGILPDDPTTRNDSGRGRDRRAGDGWAEISNAGALQPALPPAAQGDSSDPRGVLGEGELDLLEWYLLNHPRPARGPRDATTRRGRRLLDVWGCTECHVADWDLLPADPRRGLAGDRRFFDLEVAHNPTTGRLEGRLRQLWEDDPDTGRKLPRREGFRVEEIFTDLKHHDVGEKFYEHSLEQGELYVLRRFRTPPLWGVGSSDPYGHDGRSPTLDAVIRRHGGDARDAADAYRKAPEEDRRALIRYLRSLVLYSPDRLPTDLDGDGRIAGSYRIGGHDLGPEVALAELLFARPPRYRGWIEDPDGRRWFSRALLNLDAAYGLNLPALEDKNRNALPDRLESSR